MTVKGAFGLYSRRVAAKLLYALWLIVVGSTMAFVAGISHGAFVREVSSKAFLTEIPQSSSIGL